MESAEPPLDRPPDGRIASYNHPISLTKLLSERPKNLTFIPMRCGGGGLGLALRPSGGAPQTLLLKIALFLVKFESAEPRPEGGRSGAPDGLPDGRK